MTAFNYHKCDFDVCSIYIPQVLSTIPKERVVHVLQKHLKLGIIKKIECFPQKNNYYSCCVFFKSWSNHSNAMNLLARLKKNQITNLEYDKDKFWQLCLNTSEETFYPDPKHIDLVLYINQDYNKKTILDVLEKLYIGKVKLIEFEQEDRNKELEEGEEEEEANKYQEQAQQSKTVKIRFAFWYRSKYAHHFQNELYNNSFIDIPTVEGNIWTFYSTAPKYEGNHPNVWKSSIDL